MRNCDDEAPVALAQTDPEAFAALYDRYGDRIYAYAYRHVQDAVPAQDVTAVTFEKALRHIRKYRWQGKSFCDNFLLTEYTLSPQPIQPGQPLQVTLFWEASGQPHSRLHRVCAFVR